MRLQIDGGSQFHHRHCRNFIRMFSKKFLSKELSKQILIKLIFKRKKLIGYGEDQAEVEWVDSSRHPRRFKMTIYINKSPSLLYIISSLAHEMVHVKQYVKNELIDLSSTDFNVSVYKNKRFNSNKVPYSEQPWEIEAYGRTPGLIIEYFEKANVAQKLLKYAVDF